MTVDLRNRAEEVARHLAADIPAITGVCLFGSVARGDAAADSDIDLLVLGTDRTITPSALRRRMRTDADPEAVSFAYYTPETLSTYLERWPRFSMHLRQEGQLLLDRDGALRSALDRDIPLSTRGELQVQMKHLRNYDRLERFGGNFLFCLAHMARVGRTVSFALLAERGIFEFVRGKAFARLSAERPEARRDVAVVASIQPFQELVSKGREGPLPYPPRDCEDEVASAREAIRRLILLSRHADELAG